MATKRRALEVFSLSFLDCICCGFGAMLLLFVLTIGKVATTDEAIVAEIKQIVSRLVDQIMIERKQTGDIRNRLRIRQERLAHERLTLDQIKKDRTDLEKELALLLTQQATLKDELDRLLAEKKEIPKVDEKPPIPIPNIQRRQYLTGFNFTGDYVVILIEASGGMVGNTVEEAVALNSTLSDEDKRGTIKWRRVVRSVQWIIANLAPSQSYQVVVFSDEAHSVLPVREAEWFNPMDRDTTAEVLRELAKVTPRGPANLEHAFVTLKGEFGQVETIMLLADGLPTQSDSVPVGSMTDDRDRERLFRAAFREVPRDVPINTILFPMSGDPAAPFLFWQLADATKGALISPAPGWPDI